MQCVRRSDGVDGVGCGGGGVEENENAREIGKGLVREACGGFPLVIYVLLAQTCVYETCIHIHS